MDIGGIMKLRQAWGRFTSNHPKFPGFLNAVKQKGVHEGDIVEIAIRGADGKTLETNIKVTASDLELFESLKEFGVR